MPKMKEPKLHVNYAQPTSKLGHRKGEFLWAMASAVLGGKVSLPRLRECGQYVCFVRGRFFLTTLGNARRKAYDPTVCDCISDYWDIL